MKIKFRGYMGSLPVPGSLGCVAAIEGAEIIVYIEEIVTLSDNLMYSVKKSGKNNIKYEVYEYIRQI